MGLHLYFRATTRKNATTILGRKESRVDWLDRMRREGLYVGLTVLGSTGFLEMEELYYCTNWETAMKAMGQGQPYLSLYIYEHGTLFSSGKSYPAFRFSMFLSG